MAPISSEINQKIERSYKEFLRLYRKIPASARVEPELTHGWSVKDHLAHIAAWQWRCVFLLKAASETDGPLKAKPDIVGLTREFYRERQHWSWREVEIDLHRAYQALLEVIQQLPPDRLRDTIVQQTIARETWERYTEHLLELERWHKQLTDKRPLVTTMHKH